MNRLFSIFWLVWCFLIPLAAVVSTRVREMVVKAGIPIPKLIFGILFNPDGKH